MRTSDAIHWFAQKPFHEKKDFHIDDAPPGGSFTQVPRNGELLRSMAKESEAELESVNQVLNDELLVGIRLPEVEQALENREAVEVKVQEASDKPSQVNLRRKLSRPFNCRVLSPALASRSTPAIGIAIFQGDGTTAEALIGSADAAMYRAKQTQCGYAFASGNP